jgi:hypothetical protein
MFYPSEMDGTPNYLTAIERWTLHAGRSPNMLVYNLTAESKKSIATALAKAMAHAQRVSIREHIKADRFERVNQFVTSLRRELTVYGVLSVSTSKDCVANLCNKAVWYDIGVPVEDDYQLAECLRMARQQVDRVDVQTQEIEMGLEMAGADLKGVQHLIVDVDRINEESDVVLQELQKLFV